MTASILDGKKIAERFCDEIALAVSQHVSQGFRAPSLAVILLGDDPASLVYVNHKRRLCQQTGIVSIALDLPASTSEMALLELIDELNQDAAIDGILVQLPLPSSIDEKKVIERIAPHKDVDGFHPYNLGRLAQGHPTLHPCTPWGVMELLNAYQIETKGKDAVVVGASNIVGRPMAFELLMAGATTTICHSKTQHLDRHIACAEILISAIGKPGIIQSQWIKPGAVVVDVGIIRLPDGKLRGDIDFDSAKNKAAWITPVPGGVGPMTVAMLLRNTLYCATQGQKK